MATSLTISQEEAIREIVAGFMPKNARTGSGEGHVHPAGASSHAQSHPIGGADHTGVITAGQHGSPGGDLHTTHAYLPGRAGGQTFSGGSAASENLILDSTAHATKGQIRLQSILRMAASPNNIIQDSGGTARVTVATAAPHLTLGGVAGGVGSVRVNDHFAVGAVQSGLAVVRIGMPTNTPNSQLWFTGTKVGATGAGISLVNFSTAYDPNGAANAFAYPFNVEMKLTDGVGGGQIDDYSAFNIRYLLDATTITRLSAFQFPHPSNAGGAVAEFCLFDVGDVDEALSVTDAAVLRIGDRGGADPSMWGLGTMTNGGTARPIWQEYTSAEMFALSSSLGAFFSVHAADITFGANQAPGSGRTVDIQGKGYTSGEMEIDGDLNHDGANVGFYGVAPVARAGAYTQTYATADKTHAAFTSADLAAFTGGSVGFLDAAERDGVRTQFNALRADVADVKQLVNSVIDDLQAIGVAQ